MKLQTKHILLAASLVVVIVIYHTCYGLQTLVPANDSWLMTIRHDWGTHYLSWLFYKNEPWHFPIGHVNNYFYPAGTNVGFTDSIPLFAIFFKLFSPLLPDNFQYFGIWLFSCHLLAAWFTIRLFERFTVPPLFAFIGVVFVVANPVLIYRGLHPALCAQWLLIASVYVYFLDPSVVRKNKILLYQFILLVISSLVNPYLCYMVLGFTLITPLRLWFYDKVLTTFSLLKYLAASALSLLALFYIVGLLGLGEKEQLGVEGGYGLYGLNLNALFNPQGFSSYLPALSWVSPHQYEGFMYLGMGMFFLLLLLMLFGIFHFFRKVRARELYKPGLRYHNVPLTPLIILMVLFTLFSISHVVTLNEKVLFKVPLPGILVRFGEIFRASARFFWTPYYLIMFVAVIGIAKINGKTPIAFLILLMGLLIQLFDTRLILTYRDLTPGSYNPPIESKHWSALMKGFDEIAFVPPFQANNLALMDYQDFCYLAAKERKAINTGYVARADYSAMKSYTDSMTAGLEKGNLSPKTLYITTSANLPSFSFALQTGSAGLHLLDNYYYLYATEKQDEKLAVLSNELDKLNKGRIDSAVENFSKKVSFAKTNKLLWGANQGIKYFIEKERVRENYLSLSGWAFLENSGNNKGDSVFLLLEGNAGFYVGPATLQLRPDISLYFKKPYLDDAGFNAIITTDGIQPGEYKLGVGIKARNGKLAYVLTEKPVKVGASVHVMKEKTKELPPPGDITFNAEIIETNDVQIRMSGWAFFKDQHTDGVEISLILQKDGSIYTIPTERVPRPDVTAAFNNRYRLDNSGYALTIEKRSLEKGNYQLGIAIRDAKKNKTAMVFTGKEVQVQ